MASDTNRLERRNSILLYAKLSSVDIPDSELNSPRDPYLDFLQLQKSCDGKNSLGRGDGDTVVRCKNNQLMKQDCAADGQVCTYDAKTNMSQCRPADPSAPCKRESGEGRCSNGWLFWCEMSNTVTVKAENCSAMAKTCKMGYMGYHECRF